MIQPQAALKIEVLDRTAAIDRLPKELDELTRRSLEGNVFAEALMFIPALELIDRQVELRIVCLRDRAGMLVGVVPFAIEQLRSGVPLYIMRNWQHRYCFLGTPLIDAAATQQVMAALSAWIASGDAPAGGIEWVKVSWDGPFGEAIRDTFAPSHHWAVDSAVVKRAFLEKAATRVNAISGGRAKELRRLERRLAEKGTVSYAALAPPDDWQLWFDEFLTLEASGWKGIEGSAIGSKSEDREFFRRVLERAHATGQLQMLALRLDNKAIAMKLNLRARGVSFSLKIAHDERYAQFSPGVLLELFNIRMFDEEPAEIMQMDSCADPNHSMIDHLWAGRREIAFVTVVRRGLLLRTFVRLRPILRRMNRLLRFKSM